VRQFLSDISTTRSHLKYWPRAAADLLLRLPLSTCDFPNNTITGNTYPHRRHGGGIAPFLSLRSRTTRSPETRKPPAAEICAPFLLVAFGTHLSPSFLRAGTRGDHLFAITLRLHSSRSHSRISVPSPVHLCLIPLFVKFSQGDYHLSAGSPCIDPATMRVVPRVNPAGLPAIRASLDALHTVMPWSPVTAALAPDRGMGAYRSCLLFPGISKPRRLMSKRRPDHLAACANPPRDSVRSRPVSSTLAG